MMQDQLASEERPNMETILYTDAGGVSPARRVETADHGQLLLSDC
jgi:hypothetical protein